MPMRAAGALRGNVARQVRQLLRGGRRPAAARTLPVRTPLNRAAADVLVALERRVLMSAAVPSTIPDGTVIGPTVSVDWNGQATTVLPNQYIVRTAHSTQFAALARRDGFTNVESLGGEDLYQFTSPLSATAMEQVADRKTTAFSLLAPDAVGHVASTVPNDQYFDAQWNLNNTGQLESYDYNGDERVTPYNEQIYGSTPPASADLTSPPYPNENQYGTVGNDDDTEKAWDVTTGSKSVVVAVLDTGIDLTHPDLVNNIWTNPLDTAANDDDGDGYPGDVHGYNFIANDADPADDQGHGTNVAGIIGAEGNNGIGVTGVNWNVSLLPVKVSDAQGSIPEAAAIAGINYCITLKDHGINIVVMNESFGGLGFPSDVAESVAEAAAGKAGILAVIAAGNDGVNLDRNVSEPAKSSLADANVITVGAVDNLGKMAVFSDFGASAVDLGAPGINIYSTAPTYEVTADQNQGLIPDTEPFVLDYAYDSGTSQATPNVTGVIALEAAANPSATPAQLKEALLKGVTYDPFLAAANGKPALVATSGVVNAYNAVLDVKEPFVGTNTTHGGAYQNFYGSQGAYVVGESTSFPSVAAITLGGGSPVVLADATHNPAAAQQITDPTERISAYEAAAVSQTINLDFTDGLTHQTSLYVADLDHKHRVEDVSVIDTATGTVLDTEQASNFTKGQYLTWNLQGAVTLQVSAISGGSAVFSGLFFDAPDTAPITAQGTDATTAGADWRLRYGSQGSYVVADNNTGTLPAYVSGFVATGDSTTVLKPTTTSPRGLQKTYDLAHNVEAYLDTPTSMDLDLSLTDGLTHNVTLYLADYNNKKRNERVQVLDTSTGAVLTTEDFSNFSKGVFATFRVSGAVDFRITNTGGPDAVLSGVFFDGVYGENASFEGTDTTTAGNWQATQYGLTSADIPGVDFPGVDDPTNPQVTVTGASEAILAHGTNDTRGLTRPVTTAGAGTGGSGVSGTRIESYLYTTTSMTLDFNPGDLVVHRLALYFADFENFHRTESVTLYNGNTNTVLSHQVLTNFRGGKYLVFDVTGPILITINNGAFPNAVLSGLFVD